jgi:hypothetical protein
MGVRVRTATLRGTVLGCSRGWTCSRKTRYTRTASFPLAGTNGPCVVRTWRSITFFRTDGGKVDRLTGRAGVGRNCYCPAAWIVTFYAAFYCFGREILLLPKVGKLDFYIELSRFRTLGAWEAELNGPYRQRLVARWAAVTVNWDAWYQVICDLIGQAFPTNTSTKNVGIQWNPTATGKAWHKVNRLPFARTAVSCGGAEIRIPHDLPVRLREKGKKELIFVGIRCLNHDKNRRKQLIGKDFHCHLEFAVQILCEVWMKEFNPQCLSVAYCSAIGKHKPMELNHTRNTARSISYVSFCWNTIVTNSKLEGIADVD